LAIRSLISSSSVLFPFTVEPRYLAKRFDLVDFLTLYVFNNTRTLSETKTLYVTLFAGIRACL
jgi:hypothetical protein